MKEKRNYIFIISVTAVYILSLLIFIFSLMFEYKNGAFASQNRFNSITRDLSRISKNYVPQSKKFYDEFLSSLGNVSDIAGLQIKYGNELIFSYPGKFSELQNINSSLVSTYSTTVFSENGIPLTLTSSLYQLKPSSIFYKGRIAFIVVLITTLVTAVYLFIFVKNGSFPTESESDDLDKIDYPDIDSYSDESILDEKENSSETESADDTIQEKTEEEQLKLTPEKNQQEEENEEEDVLAFLNEVKEDNKSDDTEEKEADQTAEEPAGLFSPITGFGWEQYMLTRLDSELVRSASSDQDISLFTIQIKDIDWSTDCGKELSRIILEKVKFNDLVFNYKDDGATAIFQNQNTDKSLVIAEELHSELMNAISQFNENFKVFIGISTRSLRLISGSRLLNESEEALHRADEDSPIIAFRVNPERYKDYLASESFQEQS